MRSGWLWFPRHYGCHLAVLSIFNASLYWAYFSRSFCSVAIKVGHPSSFVTNSVPLTFACTKSRSLESWYSSMSSVGRPHRISLASLAFRIPLRVFVIEIRTMFQLQGHCKIVWTKYFRDRTVSTRSVSRNFYVSRITSVLFHTFNFFYILWYFYYNKVRSPSINISIYFKLGSIYNFKIGSLIISHK